METQLSVIDFVKVQAATAGAAAAAKAAKMGRTTIYDPDQPENTSPNGESAGAPLTYHLTYRDRAARETQRVITLRRIDPDRSGLKLICWCHAAGAVRCFNLDGILEVFDVAIGEVFDNAEAFFSTHPMLTEPRDPVDYALRVCRHEVNVLVSVGAADGRFDPDEQDVVLIHVFDRMPDLHMDEDLMRMRLCRLAPDLGAFEAAMTQMGRFRRGDPKALIRSLRKLVDADGQIAREEAIFVTEVERQLSGVLA